MGNYFNCPFCNQKGEIEWESDDDIMNYKEVHECQECGESFFVTAYVDIELDTQIVECLNNESKHEIEEKIWMENDEEIVKIENCIHCGRKEKITIIKK